MPGETIAIKTADTTRIKVIGKTTYVIKSVYSGRENINGKISKLIMRKVENSK